MVPLLMLKYKRFSEELKIMDRNLAAYMVEEQQKELEESQKELEENKKELEESRKELEENRKVIVEKDAKIELLMKQLEEYKK